MQDRPFVVHLLKMYRHALFQRARILIKIPLLQRASLLTRKLPAAATAARGHRHRLYRPHRHQAAEHCRCSGKYQTLRNTVSICINILTERRAAAATQLRVWVADITYGVAISIKLLGIGYGRAVINTIRNTISIRVIRSCCNP